MGLLKGRFGCLRGLRQQISNKRRHELALVWIRCCLILHNLILRIENGAEDPDVVAELLQEGLEHERGLQRNGEDDEEGYAEPASEARRLAEGKRRREELKALLFESGVADRPN